MEAIVIEDVWKLYERGRSRRRDIRSTLAGWWNDVNRPKEKFNALESIDLRVEEGDTLAIIGANGAGKSTLLKLISRITYPSKGKITIRGTLSSMLEVGTGFHPELTGRENIFLNGAILGMTREEVAYKLDSIIDFSGVEASLDTPIKHYSSGMYVRLAFSVAAHLEPDILLIDEVMSVGDQQFREKSLNKILEITQEGRTILMVSHQMEYLKMLCKKGIYLREGKIVNEGAVDEVINHYLNDIKSSTAFSIADIASRKGNGKVRITELQFRDQQSQIIPVIAAGQFLSVLFELTSEIDYHDVEVKLEFIDLHGHRWLVSSNAISDSTIYVAKGITSLVCNFPKFPLNKNFYTVNVFVFVQNQLSDEVLNAQTIEVDKGLFYPTGKLPATGVLVDYSWAIHSNQK